MIEVGRFVFDPCFGLLGRGGFAWGWISNAHSGKAIDYLLFVLITVRTVVLHELRRIRSRTKGGVCQKFLPDAWTSEDRDDPSWTLFSLHPDVLPRAID